MRSDLWLPEAKGKGGGVGRRWSYGTNFQLQVSTSDIMYNRMAVANTAVGYTVKLLTRVRS